MPWRSRYQEATLRARNEAIGGGGVPNRAVAAVLEIIAKAIADIVDDAQAGRISAERVQGLRQAIYRYLAQMDIEIESELGQQLRRVMDMAVTGHREGLAAVNSALGTRIDVDFNTVSTRALELLARRRQLAPELTYNTLIRRRIRALQKDVDDFTASVVARGVGAGRAALELAAIMVGDDQRMLNALKLLSSGRIHSGLIEDALSTLPMNYVDVFADLKSLISDSRRIVVSETNNAFNEANRLAALRSPAVAYLRWQVSSRHDGLRSSPDICTVLRDSDFYGLGEGVYYVETIPPLPHPNCGCGTTEVLVAAADLFGPKPVPKPPSKLDGKDLNRFAESNPDATTTRLEGEIKRANELVDYSFRNWKSMV